MKKLLLTLTCLGMMLLVSCAAAPKQYIFDKELNIQNDYDKVWSAVISFFAENSIPVKTLEKESGLIMSESQTFPESWVDCGKGSFIEVKSPTIGVFNVFVRELDNGKVKVQVNVTYRCNFTYKDASRQVTCNSTGEFERIILDYVRRNS